LIWARIRNYLYRFDTQRGNFTSGFGTVIAINPTRDAAIFIGMNQVGADPAEKAVEILRHLP